jgi:L-asparaginase / beta-aspartyl-peptidase
VCYSGYLYAFFALKNSQRSFYMPIGLVIHGGAGLLESADHEAVKASCQQAVAAGAQKLRAGGSAIDAVEAATRVLEDDPLFNAGYGSVLTREGVAEMDALLMEGKRNFIGSVAGIRRIKNPISLARLVMERTPHHILIGEGAEALAQREGMPLVDPSTMIAPHQKLATNGDTVGAVALDMQGNVAVAVSTGGMSGKMPGRVGDSPIPGSGGYAENGLGGVSATGVGETIMRAMLSFRTAAFMKDLDAASAVRAVMPVFARFDGDGGLIALDMAGRVGVAHNTPFLPAAWLDGEAIIASVRHHQ